MEKVLENKLYKSLGVLSPLCTICVQYTFSCLFFCSFLNSLLGCYSCLLFIVDAINFACLCRRFAVRLYLFHCFSSLAFMQLLRSNRIIGNKEVNLIKSHWKETEREREKEMEKKMADFEWNRNSLSKYAV